MNQIQYWATLLDESYKPDDNYEELRKEVAQLREELKKNVLSSGTMGLIGSPVEPEEGGEGGEGGGEGCCGGGVEEAMTADEYIKQWKEKESRERKIKEVHINGFYPDDDMNWTAIYEIVYSNNETEEGVEIIEESEVTKMKNKVRRFSGDLSDQSVAMVLVYDKKKKEYDMQDSVQWFIGKYKMDQWDGFDAAVDYSAANEQYDGSDNPDDDNETTSSIDGLTVSDDREGDEERAMKMDNDELDSVQGKRGKKIKTDDDEDDFEDDEEEELDFSHSRNDRRVSDKDLGL